MCEYADAVQVSGGITELLKTLPRPDCRFSKSVYFADLENLCILL
jgi:hypothetical protein